MPPTGLPPTRGGENASRSPARGCSLRAHREERRRSPRCRSPSARQPVLVIVQNLVRASRVEIGKGGATRPNREEFGRERAACLVAPHALQPFLGGPSDSGGHAFTGRSREFTYAFLGERV